MRRTGTLIVGGGQAGLAVSHDLARAGHDHVVVERGRIGERWRSERWDSLRLLSPNWLNRLPGEAPHADPHAFVSRDAFVTQLDAYARDFAGPVEEGVSVLSVRPAGDGFVVRTDDGAWHADEVVIATGDCDVPRVPEVAAAAPTDLAQIHAARYRAPEALPAGGVLVVGSGASGQQIALELRRAGRDVVLSAGRHTRMVRSYRGRDIFSWLSDTGALERRLDEIRDKARALAEANLALAHHHIDLGVVHAEGVRVTGRLSGFCGRHARFASDLPAVAAESDRRMFRALERIDGFIAERGIDAPERETIERVALPEAPTWLDLEAAGIRSIVWASGYVRRYPWLEAPAVRRDGELLHRNGITPVRGLYVVGLRFQRRRASHFIGGVGADARFIAERIAEGRRMPAPRRLREAA